MNLGSLKGEILIFTCNDVYELKNFGRFSRFIADTVAARKPVAYYVTLAGDFLSPSLLATLDKGKRKIKAMNMAKFTHVCLGNHEFDLSLQVLHARLRELKATVVNTNISGLPVPLTVPTSFSRIEEFDFTIGWLGYCTSDTIDINANVPSSIVIAPIKKQFADDVKQMREKSDFVIALTHQEVQDDIECIGFSDVDIILGGHNHDPTVGEYENNQKRKAWLVKVGSDLTHLGLCTIKLFQDKKYTIDVERIELTEDMPSHADFDMMDEKGKFIEKDSEKRYLTKESLEGKGAKFADKSLFIWLLSRLRKFYDADMAFFHAKLFQGAYDYPTGFTLADLHKEFYKFSQLTQAKINGKVLSDHVESYRTKAHKFFEQVDKGVKFHPGTQKISHIRCEEIDYEKDYDVFLPVLVATNKKDGDNGKYLCPILSKYFIENPGNLMFNRRHQPPPITVMLLTALIPQSWKALFKGRSFSSLDVDHDGKLGREEIEAAVGVDAAEAVFMLAQEVNPGRPRMAVMGRQTFEKLPLTVHDKDLANSLDQ